MVDQMMLALLIARCEQLEHQARYDALTGAYNRHALEAIRINSSVLVVAIDIIGLGETNNNLGHHEGDKLISNVTAKLQSCVRKSDYVVRFGGDEFVIIVPDADPIGTSAILDRIAQIPKIYHGYTIGFDDINTLVRNAFAKVEQSKKLSKSLRNSVDLS